MTTFDYTTPYTVRASVREHPDPDMHALMIKIVVTEQDKSQGVAEFAVAAHADAGQKLFLTAFAREVAHAAIAAYLALVPEPEPEPVMMIEDKVAAWHDGGGFGVPLHDYLGMTREQYASWVEGKPIPA